MLQICSNLAEWRKKTMDELQEQIIRLGIMRPGMVAKIQYSGADGFLIREKDAYSVAIPGKFQREINEPFNGFSLLTGKLNYENQEIDVLYITAKESVNLEKLAIFARSFVLLKYRDEILKDPLNWIDEWKDILGDSIKKFKIYDVLGEMIAFKYVYSFDKTAVWSGPKDSTQDINARDHVYEVKSTTLKQEFKISINSAFQLRSDKKESLIFCRLEPSTSGFSIDSLVKDIVSMGYDPVTLENSLESIGYPRGRRIREQSFNLLAMYQYEVNKDTFPVITLKDINNFSAFGNIVGFTLSLDLSSVPHITLKE
jgi:hypothetical protein